MTVSDSAHQTTTSTRISSGLSLAWASDTGDAGDTGNTGAMGEIHDISSSDDEDECTHLKEQGLAYADGTSIHGIKYTCEPQRALVEK